MKNKKLSKLFIVGITFALLIGGFTTEAKGGKGGKDAKKMASWEKTLTYSSDDSGTTFQNSVNDEKGMLVTTASYSPYPANQLTSMTFVYYDKKDKEKFTGDFSDLVGTLESGEDMFVQVISRYFAVIRVYKGGYEGANYKYTKDSIYVYKLSKNGAAMVGGPLDLPLNQTLKVHIIKNKVLISAIIKDDSGTQTDNYVKLYDFKLSKYVNYAGTANSDILSNSQKINLPKYFEVDDVTYSSDYSKTYKTITVYK